MTTISMPARPGFTEVTFKLMANSQTFTSPLTRATKRQELDGSRWTMNGSLPAMNKYDGALWKAFFLSLKGMVNTFNAFDPDCKVPLGPAGGTPLVAGGSQTGITLNIDGCTPSVLFLRAGDYFSVNSELKCMTADATPNGSGAVTLNFEPYLRASPADNTPIITAQPTCTMILSDVSQGAFTRNHKGIYMPITFSAYEVFE